MEKWIKHFPNGNKIIIGGKNESEILIEHYTGSRISVLDDGSIEITSKKNLYFISEEFYIKSKRLVLNVMGKEKNFVSIYNDLNLKILGNINLYSSGTVESNILGDYISFAKNIKNNALSEYKINSGKIIKKTAVVEIETSVKKEYINGESLFELKNNNGSYTLNIPGNLNMRIKEDLNIISNKLNVVSNSSNIISNENMFLTSFLNTKIKSSGPMEISSPDINITPG